MEKEVRRSLLAVYPIGEKGELEPIIEEMELYGIYKNIFPMQRLKLLESIKKGNTDITLSAKKIGKIFYIAKIGNNLKKQGEDGSSDGPSVGEMETLGKQKDTTPFNVTLNKLFEESVKDTEIEFAKLEKKRKAKHE